MKTTLLILMLIAGTHVKGWCQQNKLGMAASLGLDSLVNASGFELIGTSVSSLIAPSIPDSTFQKNREAIKGLRNKLIMCNVLFPGSLKIAGPDVNEQDVLAYLESVLRRAKLAGIPNLILGSGGARRLPEGYDKSKALTEFPALCRKMASLASRYDVTIILESLNSGETNFINTVRDAAQVVRKVDHPNFRLNVDIYHMMKENESPEEIVRAGSVVAYCEIAEREKRTLPGVMGDDFRPYLRALKKIGFTGPIVIEGNTNDPTKDIPNAFRYLSHQLAEVAKGQ